MKVTDKHVLFWGSIFSNFERASFIFEGKCFPTSEHFFMYQKAQFFGDKDTANKILLTNHPREAKKLGRQVKNFNSEEWSAVCREYMKQALRLKFSQNKDMKEELLKYPNHCFVECSPYDKIWGIGIAEDDPRADNESEWLGTNWLGQCLTEVRDEFLNNSKN